VAYGLIIKSDQRYLITELGRSAVGGSATERPRAIEKVIRNIPLWNLLLNNIGSSPTNESFVSAVKKIITDDPNLEKHLNRLLFAYKEDISCITKIPPYSKRSANLGNPRIHKRDATAIVSKPDLQKDRLTPQILETKPSTSQDGNQEMIYANIQKNNEFNLNFGVIEYRGHRVEIKDDLTYAFAAQMMKKIRHDLVRKTGGMFEDF